MGEWIVVTQAGDPGFQRFLSGLLNLVPLGGLFESITIEHGSGRLEIALGDPEPPDANTGADAHSSAAPPPGRAAPIGGSLDRRSGTSPQGVQLWQSAQFGVRGDQPRAQLQGRGPDQAIRWIAMLKYGAARQQGNRWSDWLHLQAQGCQQLGQVKTGADVFRQHQAPAFVQKGQLSERNVGNGQHRPCLSQRRHHVNQLHAALQTLKPLAGCPGGLVFGFQSGDHGRGR